MANPYAKNFSDADEVQSTQSKVEVVKLGNVNAKISPTTGLGLVRMY